MARVKYYDQASQEWKYADAALNMKGKDGYTPQKGIDYFTEEDVRELTENVLDQGVLTYNEQELTEEQKVQARENIGIDQISFDKLTEDLDASGFRITNLPIPQSGTEPATKEFVENFTIEGSTYVATDDGEGNVTIRPYLADEDELVFKSHIQNQNNPHNVTAAQVGARPNSWMPTAEEVKARPDTWIPTAAEVGAATQQDMDTAKTTAIAEAKTYTNEQVKKAAPRNLLDNSDFRNPVNQRGATTKSGPIWAYVVDRWYISLEDGETSELTPEGLTVNADFSIQQRFPKGYLNPDEEYTSAVYFSDGSFVLMGKLAFENAKFDALSITISNIGSKKISAVGLYKGRYTTETLPEYQPKGYGAELFECMRYYQRSFTDNPKSLTNVQIVFGTNANWLSTVKFPVPMRVTPEVILYDYMTGNADGVSIWKSDEPVSDVFAGCVGTDGFNPVKSGYMTENLAYGLHYTADAELR